MTDSAIPVAIVGCGIIGLNHARAISQVPGLRIAAVVDTIAPAAEGLADTVAAELGGERPVVAAHLADVVADVAIAVVCTPSGTHVDLAEQALAAGLHVVLEKPLDVSMERGRRLAALADGGRGARTGGLGDQPAPLRSGLGRRRGCRPLRRVRTRHQRGRLRRVVAQSGVLRLRRTGAARGSWTAAAPS